MSEINNIPDLQGDAAKARDYDGGHIQIIASAGSGKTETVSQRVARLVAEGTDPSEIVAFTFTTRAADELKVRIRERVMHFAGEDAANKLGNMYVGTIHGYCFQMLSKHVGRYESFEVADENQFAAFVLRYANKINVKQFAEPNKGLYSGISRFIENVQVVENEMLGLDQLPKDFAHSIETLYSLLDDHRILTYGLQISKAVEVLEDDETRAKVAGTLKHLIVDEYQDVNPAQERLIQLLASPLGEANLVVVGDDDQAIYQWRGSTVDNITTFSERYENVAKFELMTNRRSRPPIVKLADTFAQTITGRLPKSMGHSRELNGPAVDIIGDHEDEASEAADIALTIKKLWQSGYSYSQMAILVRSKTSYKELLVALERQSVPVQPGGRLGLFEMADADFFGRAFAWFVDFEWRVGRWSSTSEAVTLEGLVELATSLFALPAASISELQKTLTRSKATVGKDSRGVSLVGIVYDISAALGISNWDLDDKVLASRLGTIARFTKFVADYEAMTRHSRMSSEELNRQIGMADQGEWYFRNLASFMLNVAVGNYDDFEGEEGLVSDSVELMTIHAAKGLEWPIVFIPALTEKRFPRRSTLGKKNDWIVPRELFDAARYEGSDADERRLFYVAATRAREWLSLSAHEKVTTQKVTKSAYLADVEAAFEESLNLPPEWMEDIDLDPDQTLNITYSELADYLNCGLSYRLRNRIGFPPAIVEEIGYGKAVHHLMRAIAEETARKGRPLRPGDVDRIMATDFFLPFAGRAVSDRFRESARKLVFGYLKDHAEEMGRVWEAERPFELALPGAVISGRADVVLDLHEGKPNNLAILDYKTSVGDQEFSLQLQVYAEAGIREGLEVRGAYVHDLKEGSRAEVDTTESARAKAIDTVLVAVDGIKKKKFDAQPSVHKCGICDVRAICRSAAKS
jgi:DNA helicase-2/ATP-dependent DNA helicase PcrA